MAPSNEPLEESVKAVVGELLDDENEEKPSREEPMNKERWKEFDSFQKTKGGLVQKIFQYLVALGIGFGGGTYLDLDDRGKDTTSSKLPVYETAENEEEREPEEPKKKEPQQAPRADKDIAGKNQDAKRPSIAELKQRAEETRKRLEALK